MAAQGNASVADILKLADYKNQWAKATTAEGKKAASLAADQLRAGMGWDQGLGNKETGFYGNYNEQQLRDMAAQMQAAATPVPVINPTVSANTPVRETGKALASDYGITQDFNVIKDIFGNAVDTQYIQRLNEQNQIDADYYRGLGNSQATVLDTLKAGNVGSMASGTSRGMAAAQQISAALGLAQEAVTGTTELAQSRGQLADKYQSDRAMVDQLALTESNMQGGVLGKLASELFGYDVSRYSAEMGANSNDLASYLGYLSQQYASDAALQGTNITAAANRNSGSSGSNANSSGIHSILREAYGSEYWDSLSPTQQANLVDQYLGVEGGRPTGTTPVFIGGSNNPGFDYSKLYNPNAPGAYGDLRGMPTGNLDAFINMDNAGAYWVKKQGSSGNIWIRSTDGKEYKFDAGVNPNK